MHLCCTTVAFVLCLKQFVIVSTLWGFLLLCLCSVRRAVIE